MTKWKHFAATFFFGQAALSGAAAFAQTPPTDNAEAFRHELTAGTDSTLSFSSDQTRLGISLGYKYLLLPDIGLQVGYDTNIDYTHQSNTNTTGWSNLFGARYNIPLANETNAADLSRRFFIDLGAGFQFGKVTGTDASTKFIYDVGVGKRFVISDRVSYAPRISIRHVADQKVQFNLTPIALSLFL